MVKFFGVDVIVNIKDKNLKEVRYKYFSIVF